jgi:hypothetical protein
MCKVKILATSDLHGYLPDPQALEPCDIFLLAGDYAPGRDLEGQIRFFNGVFSDWLGRLRARHIVGIAGNHDIALQSAPERLLELPWTYLEDSPIEVDGLRIYGTPWTTPFYDWAFMAEESELGLLFAKIPQGIDILISHGPPQGILDRNFEGLPCGSSALRYRIEEAQPRAVVCCHIHEGYGQRDLKSTTVYNVSRVNARYIPVNRPVQVILP